MHVAARGLMATALAVVVVGGGVAAATRTAPTHAGALIADAQGRELVLRGFSTDQTAKSSPDGLPTFTEADLDIEQRDMGTNFVRFLISWRAVEPQEGVIDQAYLDAVAARVAWYADRGYKVMLDMHQDLWGPAITPEGKNGNGAPAWATHLDGLRVTPQDMWELIYLEPGVIRAFDHFWGTTGEHPELMDHYVKAWQAIAQRFADDDTVVAYDLMNEPYGGTIGGATFEAGPLTTLYQRTTDAIRKVDSDTWVCVEPQAFGTNWGTPSGLRHIDDPRKGDPRIAYCPHLYPLPMDLGGGYSGGNKTAVDASVEAWRGNALRQAKVLGDVPIILGEFGLDTTADGALDYVKRVYALADEMGMSVAYWARDDGSWGPYETDGTPRNLIPVLNRPYPRAVDGLKSWRIAGGGLTLTVTGTGSGEAYIPAVSAPGGVRVTGGTLDSWDPATGRVTFSTFGETTVTITPR